MIVVGAVILVVLAGFIYHVLVTLLQLFAVVVGVVLVLGGIAMLIFGRRFWGRRNWNWGPTPPTTDA
jgi:cytochrome c biogenesis protein CcdA